MTLPNKVFGDMDEHELELSAYANQRMAGESIKEGNIYAARQYGIIAAKQFKAIKEFQAKHAKVLAEKYNIELTININVGQAGGSL